ncbi:MAG: phosphotransferase [Firmicutes bacterium]|nr:phosphotransferase [Bacillota bacterium]
MSGTQDYYLIKSFSSKKNNVYLAACGEEKLVVKFYTRDGARKSRREFDCLARARKMNLRVPEPIAILDNGLGIAMQYIEAQNLCDSLNINPREEYARALADWYGAWHRAFKEETGVLSRGDGILKNFIWDGELWGVDFEEAGPGEPAADIGKTCASILNTDPMFTATKIDLCRILIERYQAQTHFPITPAVDGHIAAALLEAARWRTRGGELLTSMATKIAENGLLSLR